MAKKTPNQIAFEKEVRRIQRAITRIEKRGFEFTEKPSLQKPSRVTKKQLARLKAIKPETLYKITTYKRITGEVIPGTERRAEERRIAAIKAAQTRARRAAGDDIEWYAPPEDDVKFAILQEILDKIAAWEPDSKWKLDLQWRKAQDVRTLQDMINRFISESDRHSLVVRVEQNAQELNNYVDAILYKYLTDEETSVAMAAIATILKGAPLTFDESAAMTDIGEINGFGG